MLSTPTPHTKRNLGSICLKRTIMVGLLAAATFMGSLSIQTENVNARDGRILGGALLGAGVGAVFGGGRGAVVGAVTGGVLGAMSSPRRHRRW
jgi:outer membrane lipoprotein SlyB